MAQRLSLPAFGPKGGQGRRVPEKLIRPQKALPARLKESVDSSLPATPPSRRGARVVAAGSVARRSFPSALRADRSLQTAIQFPGRSDFVKRIQELGRLEADAVRGESWGLAKRQAKRQARQARRGRPAAMTSAPLAGRRHNGAVTRNSGQNGKHQFFPRALARTDLYPTASRTQRCTVVPTADTTPARFTFAFVAPEEHDHVVTHRLVVGTKPCDAAEAKRASGEERQLLLFLRLLLCPGFSGHLRGSRIRVCSR